jgi:hypothetical protein
MQVLQRRGTVEAVETLILMFTEELGVYSTKTRKTAHKLWAEGKLMPLLRLQAAIVP